VENIKETKIFKQACFIKILKKMNRLLIFPFIVLIKFYQTLISPLLGSNCRYQPTCSEYSIEALKTWGLFKGLLISLKRIFKCHPWGGKGYDPVPKKD
jgi:putative membrane protein insertion efficiency factor